MKLDVPVENEPTIGVAPLLDIVFLLLVFFMVTTSFTTAELPLNLAEAESVAPQPDPREPLVIEISADGAYHLRGRALDREALAIEIEREAGAGGARVVVRADEETAHGRVVTVLDLARSKGVNDVAIAVDAARPGVASVRPPPEPGRP